MTKDEALDLALAALVFDGFMPEDLTHRSLHAKAITAIKQARSAPVQEPVMVDLATMELAESVGLIGPASRTHDLHNAIQRFHDLICANATIKAAVAFSRTLEAKDEPVAWGVFEGNLHDMFFSQEEAQEMADLKGTHAEARPLYATPQRTWVGLTDEEIEQGCKESWITEQAFQSAVWWAEAKLRSKNHDS